MTTLPYDYAPPRVIDGRVRTCRLIEIGIAHVPRPQPLDPDAEQMQQALLDERTAKERNWQRAQRVLYVVSVIGILAALCFNGLGA